MAPDTDAMREQARQAGDNWPIVTSKTLIAYADAMDALRARTEAAEARDRELQSLLREAIAPESQATDNDGVPAFSTCLYCGAQTWHDETYSAVPDEPHKPDCWIVRADAALATPPPPASREAAHPEIAALMSPEARHRAYEMEAVEFVRHVAHGNITGDYIVSEARRLVAALDGAGEPKEATE